MRRAARKSSTLYASVGEAWLHRCYCCWYLIILCSRFELLHYMHCIAIALER